MARKKVNMALDISFSIETKHSFENLTKDEIIRGLCKRLYSLLDHWEPEAIGYCDEYELEE